MSNKEISDLKILIKALDIRLENNEISQDEYNNLKEKYDAKSFEEVQEQVAMDFQQIKYQEAMATLFERLSMAEQVTFYPENLGD